MQYWSVLAIFAMIIGVPADEVQSCSGTSQCKVAADSSEGEYLVSEMVSSVGGLNVEAMELVQVELKTAEEIKKAAHMETGNVFAKEAEAISAAEEGQTQGITKKGGVGTFVAERKSCCMLADLGYGGQGSRSSTESRRRDPRRRDSRRRVAAYQFKFSSGFQGDICTGEDHETTYCWGSQGISKYGDFITRSFYQWNAGDEGPYIAINIMNGNDFTYSNILVESNNGCHAGDHSLRKFSGVFWFFVACTGSVAIFSEEHIVEKEHTVNGKDFYYFVPENDVQIISSNVTGGDRYFSFISRNDGHINEFWGGKYNSSAVGLNLKLLEFSKNDDDFWSYEVKQSFTSESKYSTKVQGLTMIDGYMFLVCSTAIRKCTVSGNEIGPCVEQCKMPGTSRRRDIPCINRRRESAEKGGIESSHHRLVLQGAETDSSGDLYIGSEWDCDGKPSWQLVDMANFEAGKGTPCFETDGEDAVDECEAGEADDTCTGYGIYCKKWTGIGKKRCDECANGVKCSSSSNCKCKYE